MHKRWITLYSSFLDLFGCREDVDKVVEKYRNKLLISRLRAMRQDAHADPRGQRRLVHSVGASLCISM